MRRFIVLILTLALLPAAPAAAGPAATASSDAPAAAAAAKKRKKCKKGYERKRVRRNGKRVVRCVKKKKRSTPQPGTTGQPGQPGAGQGGAPPVADPAATWRSMVAGASFTYSTFNASNGGSSKTVFNFCSDAASFTYYYEFVGSVYNEAKNRNGTYTLAQTVAGADGAGQFVDGLINYQSNIEERPSGQAVVRVYPANPGLAYINAGDGVTEFSRTAPSGC